MSRSPEHIGKDTNLRPPSDHISTAEARSSVDPGAPGTGNSEITNNPGASGSNKKNKFLDKAFKFVRAAKRVVAAVVPEVIHASGLGATGIGHSSVAERIISKAATSGSFPQPNPTVAHSFGMGMVSALQSAGGSRIGLVANTVLDPNVVAVGRAVLAAAGEVAAMHTSLTPPSEHVSTSDSRSSLHPGVTGTGQSETTTTNPDAPGSDNTTNNLDKAFKIGCVAARVAGVVAPVVIHASGLGATGIGHSSVAEKIIPKAASSGSFPQPNPTAAHSFGMGMVSAVQSAGCSGIGLGANTVLDPTVAAVGRAVLAAAGEVAAMSLKIDDKGCESEDRNGNVAKSGYGNRNDGECCNCGDDNNNEMSTGAILLDAAEKLYNVVSDELGLTGSRCELAAVDQQSPSWSQDY